MISKILSFILITLIPQAVVFADDFVPLSEGFPGVAEGMFTGGINKMLNTLFSISIGVSAVLAVIILTIGGFKYMTSESVFAIGDSREQMKGAIIGLLIVLTAVLLLKTINPDIVKLGLFS